MISFPSTYSHIVGLVRVLHLDYVPRSAHVFCVCEHHDDRNTPILCFCCSNPDPDMEQKYREMLCPKMTRWISDGLNVHPQAIQIKLASELPLDHEQTFHLIFKM